MLEIHDSSEDYGGPTSLEDYCAMKEGKLVRRQKVNAVPHSGGDPQPGVVVKANDDGTVDVLFKDGNHDMNLPVSDVTPRDQPEGFEGSEDSACIAEGEMSKVQKDVDTAYDEIKAWLRRRKEKGHKAAAEEDKAQVKENSKAKEDAKKELVETKRGEQEAEQELRETQDKEVEAEEELEGASNTGDAADAKKKLEDIKDEVEEQKKELKTLKEHKEEATKDLKEADSRDVANAGNVEGMAAKLARAIKNLEGQRAELKKKNQLDPDLRVSMDEVIVEAKQAEDTLKKVGEAEEKGGDHLVATVEEAETELKDAKNDMRVAEAGIYPSGDKWWRFRYEFSYVEAMFAVLMSAIALLGECCLHLLRKVLNQKAKEVRWQDERSVPTMYMTWFRFLGYEGIVLLFMNLSVWLLWQTVPWVYESWATVARDPKMHLPVKPERYKLQAWETAVHLTLAMIMYFLAIYMVVHNSSGRLKRWQAWSTETDAGEDTPRAHPTLGVSVIGSAAQFKALLHCFISEIRMRPDLLDYAKNKKVIMNEDFPFFLYLSLCHHHNLQDVFVVKIWTWGAILSIFGVFAVLHRYAHLGTAELLCFFGAFMIIIFGVMTYKVIGAIAKIGEERSRISHSQRVDDADLKAQKKFEHVMCAFLQVVIFFLCFGAVRLTCSYWMWRLYFWYSVICTAGLILFAILWFFTMAPLISAFLAVVCCPPYVHHKAFEKTVKIMRPPEVDISSNR